MATREYDLGTIDGVPEVRITWHGIDTRSTHHHAIASIDADISDEAWDLVKECALYAGGGAVLASIFTAGAGALPGFWAAFSGCIAAKSIDISSDRIHLRTETHHGEWH
jgi:hypothetical protein